MTESKYEPIATNDEPAISSNAGHKDSYKKPTVPLKSKLSNQTLMQNGMFVFYINIHNQSRY